MITNKQNLRGSIVTLNQNMQGAVDGGGTKDYEKLNHLPSVNGVELKGNKSLSDLGIQPEGNYIETETDPVFSASAAAGITSGDITTWNAKGTYSKPVDGIPSTDLSSGVQASLGKADTALQSETYTGTITSIKMNGSTVASSGEADLGTVITSHQDISGKQDTLVSGTNIKTINNTSILGSGNITISGSGGAWGSITGTLSDQTDLQNALNNKADKSIVPDETIDLTTELDYIASHSVGDYPDGSCDVSDADVISQLNTIKQNITNGEPGKYLFFYDCDQITLTSPFYSDVYLKVNRIESDAVTLNSETSYINGFGHKIFDQISVCYYSYLNKWTVSFKRSEQIDVSGKENTSNKVTSISSSSTNTEYPSALAVYNLFSSITDADNINY